MLQNYFKNLCADLRAGRLLLHPIVLTAAFLAVHSLYYYVVFHGIFGERYRWDFVRDGILAFLLEFSYSAYFIAVCTHLLLVRKIGRCFALMWAALAVLLVAACFLGYYAADSDHQKEGVFNFFFLASLIAVCIYLIFLAVKFRRFLPIIYAAVFVASYALAIYIVFKTESFRIFSLARALSIVCPLLWAFYFKFEFQRISATQDKDGAKSANASAPTIKEG